MPGKAKGTANFDVTLIFNLPDPQESGEKYVDKLFEAGADMCLIGHGIPGKVVLDCTVEAPSREKAVDTIKEIVAKAILGSSFDKEEDEWPSISQSDQSC